MADNKKTRSPRKLAAPIGEVQQLYDVMREAIVTVESVLKGMGDAGLTETRTFDGGGVGGRLADELAAYVGGLHGAYMLRDRKKVKQLTPKTGKPNAAGVPASTKIPASAANR